MGTAVLHPQECLPPLQSHPSGGSLLSSAYAAATETCGRHSSFDTAKNRGILGHTDPSVGLLPLPELVPQIAYSSPIKLSPCSYKRRRSPASTYGGAKPMRRCSLSSRDLSSHGRRQPPCEDFGNAEPRRLYMAGGISARPPIAKLHFSPISDDAMLKRSEHEANFQPIADRCSTAATNAKQLFDEVVPRRTQSLVACNSSKSFTKRQGGRKQLNYASSGKFEGKGGTDLAMSWNQQIEVGGKLLTSLSNISGLAQEGDGLMIGCPALSMEKEIAQASSQSCTKSWSFPQPGVACPSSQFDARIGGALAQKPRLKVMELREIERSHQCSPKGHLINVAGLIDSRSSVGNTTNFNWHFRAKDLFDCLDPPYDQTNIWLSMVDEKWAGPSFFNSPPPSSLPVPKFMFKLSGAASTSPKTTNDEASLSLNGSFPEVKDVAFATKDLRRLLRIDPGSCEA
ncbi:hypothetical protein GOP47_0028651 [Adiantum capillus-veneris]|nr:hypothetical protein GOP47_0028651 [Adiantum capillus-veneris]